MLKVKECAIEEVVSLQCFGHLMVKFLFIIECVNHKYRRSNR